MLAHGLRNRDSVKLERQPRMADFAHWATACETAAWDSGTFLTAYEANRNAANDEVISGSQLALAICTLLDDETGWEGTSTDLLNKLSSMMDGQPFLKDKAVWPQTPKRLSERLSRIMPALRRSGIEIERHNGSNHRRVIKLYKTNNSEQVPPSAPPAPPPVAARGRKKPAASGPKTKPPAKFARKGRPT
jgi:hypothetical protein